MKNKLLYLVVLLLAFFCLPSVSFAQKIMANASQGLSGGEDIIATPVERCLTYSSYFYIDEDGKGSVSNLSWDFGDGNTSVENNPYHIFQTDEDKSFNLKVTFTQGGQSKTLETVIKISTAPEVDFSVSTTEGCDGTQVFFTIESSIRLKDVKFTVNGQVLAENELSNPLPAREQPYTATIYGTTDNDCAIKTTNEYITISELIVPSISPSSLITCATQVTQTFNASTIFEETGAKVSSGVTYEWDFGDGNTAQGSRVSNNYDIAKGDHYTLTVTATYGGCSQTASIPVALGVDADMFTYELPDTYCAIYPVTFTPSLPDNLDGQTITWDFGDGVKYTSVYPEKMRHNFTNTRSYTVTKTVTAKVGSCSYTLYVDVPPMELSDISIKANRSTFCTNNFNVVLSIQNLNGRITNFFWRRKGVDERLFENEDNPTIPLTGYGEHIIELVANDAGECVINEIEISSYPIEAEIMGLYSSCAPHTLTIGYELIQDDALIKDNSTSRRWEAEERSTGKVYTSTSKNFELKSLEAGVYDIIVQIDFAAGCTVTASDELKVGEAVKVDFEVLDGPDYCNGSLIEFNNTTDLGTGSEGDVTFLWDYFGTDVWTSSFGRNGIQTYDHLEPGEYSVGLKAVQDGCEGQPVYKKITILEPLAKFELGVTELCDPDKIYIENESIGAGEGSDYIWDIEVGFRTAQIITKDINEDIVNHPDFQALAIDYGDEVSVTLTVENSSALPSKTPEEPPVYCVHSVTSSIYIAQKPEPIEIHWDFTYHENIESYTQPSEICQGTTLYFDPKVTDGGYYSWSFKKKGTNKRIYPSYSSRTTEMTFSQSGVWVAELNAQYYNGCSEVVEQGEITVRAMEFDVTSNVSVATLGDEVTYSVRPGYKIEAPNPKWEWYHNDEMVKSGTGTVVEDFVITYDELNKPQYISNYVYLKVTADLTSCEVYSNYTYTLVTKPILDFPEAGDDTGIARHISFNFQCDYLETYIDPKVSDTTVYSPYYAEYRWRIKKEPEQQWSSITSYNRDNYIFQFNSFTEGTYTLELTIKDRNGYSEKDTIYFEVPELPKAVAGFTATDSVLNCPGAITFTDKADGTEGNSIPRKYADGSDVPIYSWKWTIMQEDLLINTIESSTGELEYYFISGDYEVYLETTDVQYCTATAAPIAINVKGVTGSFYINKKAGYAPLTTDMVALPAYVSSEVIDIAYNWASGDGYNGVDSLQTFTYELDSNIIYTPKLVFESTLDLGDQGNASCNYDAITDESITIFKKPELEIEDVVVCITESPYTVEGYDKDFEVANLVVPDKFSYKGVTKYQWSVDGENIPASSGGTDALASFTYGSSGGYFEVNPNDEEGRDYTLEIWVDAEYIDFIDSKNNHTDTGVGYSTRTFNVKFTPSPVPVIGDLVPVCMLDSATFDGSQSNFTPYTTGEIVDYTWEFLLDGSVVDSYTTTDPISHYKFAAPGTYTVNLTVSSDNTCTPVTTSSSILIYALPDVSFEAEDVCVGEPTLYNNTSTYEGVRISDNPNLVKGFVWYFDWENDSTTVSSTAVSPTFTYAAPGTYKVKLIIESLKGCTKEIIQEVYVSDYPYLVQKEDFYVCEGSSTTLSVEGGTVFEWSTGETTSEITVSPTEDITEYRVKAWNDTGCFTEASVQIFIIKLPKPTQTLYYACEGDDVEIDGTIEGFEGTLGEYQWSNGTVGSKVTVSEPGIYTLTNLVTHDISGVECLITHEYEFIHRPLPPAFAVQDTLFCFEELGEIVIQAAEAPGYVYLWEDSGETTSAVTRYDGGEYTVKIIDTSTEDNCETVTSMKVTRGCPPIFFNPTAFTPNGDGINDEFLIRSKYVVNIKLTVYNSWGEIIFHDSYENSNAANQEGRGWDGTYQNKLVPGSVYTIVIEYDSEFFGTHHRDVTNVTVIR
ncbi:PKD domain-containing protein [Flammeovirga sp. EKP202]|uniref:PKD domain-containing protein n=1 Tax=Flammeovirga sp. EKP202 TaxID=2770592 RepID=UPI00165F9BEE|nr:PKD domain-containing protein [Flammeovirga sp. EKP202]MBD0403870.1 PKD domain-containing protein [Flammeovirga sp. EKP202]